MIKEKGLICDLSSPKLYRFRYFLNPFPLFQETVYSNGKRTLGIGAVASFRREESGISGIG